MKTLSAVLIAVLAVGCAHGSKNTKEEEPGGKPNPQVLQKLKDLAPHASGNGVVVVYRNTAFGSMFGPIPFNGSLWVDDQAIGDVADDKYNLIELPAGRHSFRVMGTVSGMVLQATTVVTVAAGEKKLLDLHTVQEFNNATVRFQPGGSLESIAVDCTEGFVLDLGPTQASAPAPARM